ncbi:leucine-rich repeat-containing protein 7-like [Pagrus major]|uniref:leucine-rich repeat-containing protein 7-like n=1 Tax=Pagrus major TaxID=143350 RepID=UPI003CC8DC57
MTTYFHSHEFCCSPKKPSSGATKSKSGKGKAKSGKGHSHSKHNQNLLQIQTPNHQLQPSPLHSPKHHPHSPQHGCHSPKHLLLSPSPSYYHIAPSSPSHQLAPPSPTCQLAPLSPNRLLHSPSHHQLHLSPSHHQLHLSPSHHQLHLSPSHHQLHVSPSHHQLQHHCQNQQQYHPPPSPGHLLPSQSTHQIYHHQQQQQQVQLHSPSHLSLFQQYQHHPHYTPPLPHASQSLSIHPFHSPQLPLCSALGGYGWSTLPTNLATRGSRGKFPNLRDSVKKSPTKSKAKGKAGSRPWPNDTYIWTAHSMEAPTHTPPIHHFPQIKAHVQDSMGGSPNDIRISDMRPTLVEPPMYKPKVVLLGKDKKESTDEEVDKLHCLNHSGSSATYSDYSPSQGSSGSSNPPANAHSHSHTHTHSHAHQHTPALQAPTKDQAPQTHWTNRLAQSFPKPIDSKPLLSQRETPPSGTLQQRGDRRPLSEPFDWSEAPHYDNTGFDAEESPLDAPSSTGSQGNPPLGSKPRSQSTHGRRPLLRQERIVGVPLELDTQTLPFHSNQRSTPDNDPQSGPSSQNPWQNWTRTPSPLEDRTAFPSKLDMTPSSSPNPDRKDIDSRMEQGAGPLPGSWTYHNNQGDQNRKDQLTVSGGNKVTVVMSKSSDRLSPMMRETRSKFKKSQSIDEIDIGSYKVYSIPMDSYSSSIEQQTSLDRPELPGSMEQTSMSRSQSAPMLDDELGFPGHGHGHQNQGQNQKPAIPQKAYHFDHNYNPQVTMDRRVPPPFPNTPDYVNHSSKALEYINQPGKTLPKELVSPRYRAYPPLEMFSFPQSPINQDGPSSQQQQPIPSQRSRPGFLRRADSLVSSTELALFRRVHEAQQEALQEAQYRQQADPPLYSRALAYSTPMEHSAVTNIADSQSQMMHNKRNGRYDDDYPTYQEQKKPMIGYPTKSLTQRRPLSARSYSTETYGASQVDRSQQIHLARPVSARPTMAALLEKMPPDYTLATCPEKPSDDTIKVRPVVPQKPEDITSRMPADWRQQLLRHIEAKRLDRSGVLKHNTLTLGMLCQGGGHGQGRSSTLNFNLYNNTKHEPPAGRWLPLPPPPSANATPSQQAAMLDNDQEGLSGSNQWAPYSLGRRDVPPDNLMKKNAHPHNPSHQSHNTHMIVTSSSSSSSTTPHRVVGQQVYDGMMNKGGQYQPGMPLSVVPSGGQYQGNMSQGHSVPGQGYPGSGLSMAMSPSGNQPQYNPHSSHTSHQPSLPATNPQYHGNQGMVHSNQVVMTHTNPRPQSARCLLQTKGQKSTDGFQEQLCVRIEKNPGLGFSISGGISGQGNPFKPSDMGIFVTRVQHDGPAASALQPGDKILQANGHSFLHMEHETAVSLLKSFQRTVDLTVLRDSSTR